MDLPAAFRILHIAAGVVALLSFPVPLLSKKGSRVHRVAGRVYAVAMAIVVVAAFVVCAARLSDDNVGNDNAAVFLAYVGFLAGANIVLGLRALREENKKRVTRSSDALSLFVVAVLVLLSLLLAVTGLLRALPLWMAFGGLGVFLGASNARTLLTPPLPQGWFFQHLANMCAACIGTVTAVLVVNADQLAVSAAWMPVVWTAPGLIGGIGIGRLTAHYRKKFAPKTST